MSLILKEQKLNNLHITKTKSNIKHPRAFELDNKISFGLNRCIGPEFNYIYAIILTLLMESFTVYFCHLWLDGLVFTVARRGYWLLVKSLAPIMILTDSRNYSLCRYAHRIFGSTPTFFSNDSIFLEYFVPSTIPHKNIMLWSGWLISKILSHPHTFNECGLRDWITISQ